MVSVTARSACLVAGALVVAALAVVAIDAASPKPSAWRGGFETGDLSQWSGWQGRSEADQIALVATPSRDGLAARFTVRPGDRFSSGERSELVLLDRRDEQGATWWYAWSTLFPGNWVYPEHWGIIVQWHSDFDGPPPLAFDARDDTLVVTLNAGDLGRPVRRQWRLLDSLSKGAWNDFVARIHWSAGTDGEIDVWHRVAGRPTYRHVLGVRRVPTLQRSGVKTSSNYLKLGLYRDLDTKTNVVYQDSARRAATLAAVIASGPDPIGTAALRLMATQVAAPRIGGPVESLGPLRSNTTRVESDPAASGEVAARRRS